ncbi:MAG: hypothetical protein M1546_21980, partial [Chloroflexi bacterium]|nr:hypothetical protein [Chloroflexota bacterium]
ALRSVAASSARASAVLHRVVPNECLDAWLDECLDACLVRMLDSVRLVRLESVLFMAFNTSIN